jgi:hypothetical protein
MGQCINAIAIIVININSLTSGYIRDNNEDLEQASTKRMIYSYNKFLKNSVVLQKMVLD